MAQRKRTRLVSIKDVGLIPVLTGWIKDLVLLLQWHRPVTAASIRPLAWELPCAMGAVLKRQNKRKKRKGDLSLSLSPHTCTEERLCEKVAIREQGRRLSPKPDCGGT